MRPLPVPSVVNFGGQARASRVAVMIDGARMLTPGVVRGCSTPSAWPASPVVSCPDTTSAMPFTRMPCTADTTPISSRPACGARLAVRWLSTVR